MTIKTREKQPWIIVLIAVVIALVLFFLSKGNRARAVSPVVVTDEWKPAPILSITALPEHTWSRIPRVIIYIRYEYEVDGEKYSATRYDPSGEVRRFSSWNKEAIEFTWQIKQQQVAWYNPKDPSMSVLMRDRLDNPGR